MVLGREAGVSLVILLKGSDDGVGAGRLLMLEGPGWQSIYRISQAQKVQAHLVTLIGCIPYQLRLIVLEI